MKIYCLECNAVFDSDYRKKHNEKQHGYLLRQHKSLTTGATKTSSSTEIDSSSLTPDLSPTLIEYEATEKSSDSELVSPNPAEAEISVEVLEDHEEEAIPSFSNHYVSWFQCVGQLGAMLELFEDGKKLFKLASDSDNSECRNIILQINYFARGLSEKTNELQLSCKAVMKNVDNNSVLFERNDIATTLVETDPSHRDSTV